jgi:PAS domain S-box-containing protein
MQNLIIKISSSNVIIKCAFTVLVSLAVIGIKIYIPNLGFRVPYLLVLFAVILSAYFGGFWQGLLSTVITGTLANYFFYNYPYSFNFSTFPTQAATISFFLEGFVVTWLIETQRKTIQKNEQLAMIIESSQDAVIGKTLKDMITSWNKGAEKMYGYKAEEVIGKSISIIIPKEAQKEEALLLKNIKNKITINHRQSLRITKCGEKMWVSVTSSPVVNTEGKVIGLSTIARDISEIKETERKIKEQAELLQLAHDAIIVQDSNNQILFWNRGAAKLYGYTNKEALTKPASILLKTKFPINVNKIYEIIKREKFWEGELIHTGKDGKEIIVESRWAFINKTGKTLRVLEINRDITQRKVLEQKLRDVNKRLEQKVNERTKELSTANINLARSNQELQDFAYIASHDLQEPLRKIQSFGNLLLEEEFKNISKDGQSYLNRMLNAATRMRVLIDDLLSYSRVTSKALPFQRVELIDIANNVVTDLEAHIKEANGKVNIKKLPTIDADPLQMRQLFQNIISNGLKFHRNNIPPSITVSSKLNIISDTIAPAADYINIYFEDNGIGINKKYVNRIFTIFERLHGRQEYEGTGIGLAIVKKIVNRHKGSIKVSSKEGAGTTFIVTLPITQKKGGSN